MVSGSFFNESLHMRDASRQKRKMARTTVSLSGEYLVGADERPVECSITDIGTGGLSMLTKTSMYVGDAVRVRLRLGSESLELAGQVVRVTGKTVGVQFTSIQEEHLEKIQDYIHTTFFQDPKDSRKNR